MKYQFEFEEITNCGDCPCCDTISGCRLGKIEESFDKIPADCPLAAIPKTETTACENGKTKTERKYDNFRSHNIQGDCYKYVCSCIGCGQVLWEIEDFNYMKGERGYKPPFCPNCGRRLEEES